MRCFIPFIVLLIQLSPILAQRFPAIESVIQQLEADPDLAAANWGLCILDAQNGELLYERNARKFMATASVMKVVTTAAALGVLGPDFTFETRLAYTGIIDKEGVLQGNLYIIGSGDPTLASERFTEGLNLGQLMSEWVKACADKGIKKVEGDIIADATVLDKQIVPENWTWEDIGNYYGAGICGLNIHENFYSLDFLPGKKPGEPTQILRTLPPQAAMKFDNEVLTGSYNSGDNAYIYGAPFTYRRYIKGTIPPGTGAFTIKGSLPDPALSTAIYLLEALQACEIKVTGVCKAYYGGDELPLTRLNSLHVHQSPALAEIVKQTNLESINLYAEALIRRMAIAAGKPGTSEGGVEALKNYWEAKGLDIAKVLVKDGSGLSPNNVITPYLLTNMLHKAYTASYKDAFLASLPVAGVSGTLERMLRGTAAQGNIRAKSGFISDVRSYAGYANTKGNKTLAFAMMANYYTCSSTEMRKKFEKIMLALVNLP